MWPCVWYHWSSGQVPAWLLPRLIVLSKVALKNERSFGSAFLSSSGWLRLVGWSLLTLCWLPSDHFAPWKSFHSELVAFSALGFLLTGSALKPNLALSIPCVAALSFAMTMLPLMQYGIEVLTFLGDAALASFFLFALFFSTIVGYRNTQRAVQVLGPLSHVLCISASISACIGLLQWLSLADLLSGYFVAADGGDRASSNLGQPNQLATLLLMGLVGLRLQPRNEAASAVCHFSSAPHF